MFKQRSKSSRIASTKANRISLNSWRARRRTRFLITRATISTRIKRRAVSPAPTVWHHERTYTHTHKSSSSLLSSSYQRAYPPQMTTIDTATMRFIAHGGARHARRRLVTGSVLQSTLIREPQTQPRDAHVVQTQCGALHLRYIDVNTCTWDDCCVWGLFDSLQLRFEHRLAVNARKTCLHRYRIFFV